MSQRRKNFSLSRIPKTRSQHHQQNEIKKNNRRTSLNVNLSYNSESSSNVSENERRISGENDLDNLNISKEKICELEENVNDKILRNIKPSYVRLTGIPISYKYGTLNAGDKRRKSRLTKSQREIGISQDSTVILNNSMDLTKVQGVLIDSTDFISDTECTEILRAPGLETVIPDSQPDASIDIERTSMNVNTSLDSSVLNPERSLAERGFIQQVFDHEERGRLSQSSSRSSFGNVPINSTIVTRAVIERNDFSNCTYSERTVVEITNDKGIDGSIELRRDKENLNNCQAKRYSNENRRENEKRIEPVVIDKTVTLHGSVYSSENGSKNVSSSSSSSASSPSPSSNRKKLGDIYQRIIFSGISKSRDLAKKVKNNTNNKKKLMRLRLSGMVDLSPVSVKQVRPTANEPLLGGKFKRRNKRVKKKVQVKSRKRGLRIGASDEEDIEEAETVPKKDKRMKRKIKAKKIVVKKFADVELRKRMNEDSRTMINALSDELYTSDDCELESNSLDDFEPKNNLLTQRKTTCNSKPKIFIVATGLSVEDRKLIKSTVTSLGSARMQKIVSRRTTHVISKGIRTVNYLRGIIRGCWMVNLNWISRSREAGKWLDAESYEMKKLSEAIEKNRRERQFLKAAYVSELFMTCGAIHVTDETSTSVSVLEELIRLGGGRVAKKPDKAKIIIGSKGLKEAWILDSITHGELQPFEGYSKKKNH